MAFVVMPPCALVVSLPSGINIGGKEGRKVWQPGSTPRYAASGPRSGRVPSDNFGYGKKTSLL